jgi:hypothetical protein
MTKLGKVKLVIAIGATAYWVFKTISDKNMEIESLRAERDNLLRERSDRFSIDTRNYNTMWTIRDILKRYNFVETCAHDDKMHYSDFMDLKRFVECDLHKAWTKNDGE